MKVGTITTTNQKGQIVIPKKLRDDLGITPQTHLNLVAKDGMLYIFPIINVVSTKKASSSYLEFLNKTQGAWGPESKEEKTDEEERRTLEVKATEKNKQAW